MQVSWKPKHKVLSATLDEIHQYASDLQRMTILRDRTTDQAEKERYNDIIEVMQLALAYLNDPKDKKDGRL